MSLYDPKTTALIVIDLQGFILGRALAPHSAETVVANTIRLVDSIKSAGGTTIFVRVGFSADYADAVNQPVDEATQFPKGGLPAAATEFHPDLAIRAPDVTITKHQWSAFYGTELDLQLRRRGIKSVILTGVATPFGVEATVRDAYAHNYAVLVAEDAVSSISLETHAFSIERILPRLARIRKTDDLLMA